MRAVNLLPKDEGAEKRKRPPLPVLAGCVGVVLVTALLAVMFLSASSAVAQQRLALDQARAAYAAVPAPPVLPAVDSQLPQQRQSRVTALATVLGQRVDWDRLLREVSQVVPSDVFLVTLNAQSPTIAPAPTGSTVGAALPLGFVLTGCTYSQDSVAQFLSRLDVVPDLSNMTLGQASASSGSVSGSGNQCPTGFVAFTLQGDVRAAGATS
ncbi:MAG TPA: PilN domain-containing protein [Gaiellaceae bacterium]|nr:PilN domain-containing protein [Gaiellaceae bacterium]